MFSDYALRPARELGQVALMVIDVFPLPGGVTRLEIAQVSASFFPDDTHDIYQARVANAAIASGLLACCGPDRTTRNIHMLPYRGEEIISG